MVVELLPNNLVSGGPDPNGFTTGRALSSSLPSRFVRFADAAGAAGAAGLVSAGAVFASAGAFVSASVFSFSRVFSASIFRP